VSKSWITKTVTLLQKRVKEKLTISLEWQVLKLLENKHKQVVFSNSPGTNHNSPTVVSHTNSIFNAVAHGQRCSDTFQLYWSSPIMNQPFKLYTSHNRQHEVEKKINSLIWIIIFLFYFGILLKNNTPKCPVCVWKQFYSS